MGQADRNLGFNYGEYNQMEKMDTVHTSVTAFFPIQGYNQEGYHAQNGLDMEKEGLSIAEAKRRRTKGFEKNTNKVRMVDTTEHDIVLKIAWRVLRIKPATPNELP